ncbi:unnamed protein product [Diabrotica balteata]|uniref:Uncharacterized protein n=1 Tax=Diabrotica balteata TaxID=107213 RepID=A0A9N9SRV7_DIABA|nr:unnamed protein product [Diabrotica balteata]
MMTKGIFVGYDKRQNSKSHNATAEIQRQQVKDHINSFPRIESHYCKRDSTKNYLNADLNISIMYRLYQDFCTSNSLSPLSKFVYQSIFHDFEPTLAFYRPKKDQCSVCNAFNQTKEKDPLREEYEKHKKAEKQ